MTACGGVDDGASGTSGTLNLVAYSTPKEAYEEIIPAFAKTPDGGGVSFSQSYGNSGDQARAVIAGLPTDIAALSLEADNPTNIKGWADLIKPGIELLTPNPFTSGGARWNIMAAYGAQIQQGRSEAEAIAYLKQLFRNVVVQDKSARESLQNFTGGKVVQRLQGARRCLAQRSRRVADGAARAVGRWQVDSAARARRARGAGQRRGPVLR